MRPVFFLFLSTWLFLSGNLFSSVSLHTIMYSGSIEGVYGDTLIDKEKIIDKIKKAFKFKANIRAKEEKRIVSIIEKVFSSDASYRSIPDLKKQNLDLAKTQKENFDSLFGITSSLSSHANQVQLKIDSLFKSFTSSACKDCKTGITDKEMDQLVAKMLPMVKEKIETEESDEERQKKIRQIRRLMAHPEGITDTVKLSDTLYKKYTIRLAKHGEVFGYHPYWMRNNYLNYNFSVLSTLAFYGYELDEKTGKYKTINGWDTAAVINAAKRAGCKVALCVFNKSKEDLNVFLKSDKAQEQLCNEICTLLKKRNADGVNILFEEIGKNNRQRFTKFIRSFSNGLKQNNAAYELTVTLPVLDENQNYDIKQLDPYVDRFIIDFTKKQNYGPIAPIKGPNYSLESGIARCLNTGVQPSKFLGCLPYYGALWDVQTKGFQEYVQYNRIEANYLKDYRKVYDGSTARVDVVMDEQDTLEQLWYDDAQTLSEKYDYLLENELGGISLWALGYDNDQPELWNALMDKMIYFDTSQVTLVHLNILTSDATKGLWAKIKRELALYQKLFSDPCGFKSDKHNKLKSVRYIGKIVLLLLILLIVTIVFYVTGYRANGDEWTYRKLFLSLLIVLVVLFTITLLMWCFVNPDFTYIGYTHLECDQGTHFGTILIVLGTGFIIGLLVMRFLVFSLIKQKQVP